MTDLVARLRASVRYEAYDGDGHERRICGRQMSEAADEIERLRVLLAEMRADRDAAELSRDAAHAEYERLRARLDECGRTIVNFRHEFSRLDYALGAPNDNRCSLYDVDCDEERVVNAALARLAEAERTVALLAQRVAESEANYDRIVERYNDQRRANSEHCRDCCCARSWTALGITAYTGKSIPEEIADLRARLAECESQLRAVALKP